MKTKLFLLSFILISAFSCKKADPGKPLSVVGAEDAPPGSSGSPFSTSTKTILASTYSAINDMVVTNNTLYLLGNFSSLGSAGTRCIVAYNGSSLSGVNNNFMSGSTLYTARYFNNRLLVGGIFTTSSSSTTRNFGYISTSGSVTGYSAVNGTVYALQDDGYDCYMAGNITSVNSIAKECGYYTSSYTVLSYGSYMYTTSPITNCMAYFDNKLFMGGSYSNSVERNIVYSSSNTWTKSGNGFNSSVYDLQIYGGRLYAAGAMNYDGNSSTPLNYVNSIANYNSVWQKAGTNNLPTTCKSLEVHGSNLIAACNSGASGYLYSYNTSANLWSNCMSGSQTYYRLDKIASFNGKLYGIEKNTSTGMTNFVRFD